MSMCYPSPFPFLVVTYIFISILVDSAVNSAVGAPPYFLHDGVLVDGMVGSAVGIVTRVF